MGAIDEKDGVVNIVFLAEFGKERMSNSFVCRRFQRCLQQFGCFRIDSSVQPVLLIIEPDHGLIHRNVIRIPIGFGL